MGRVAEAKRPQTPGKSGATPTHTRVGPASPPIAPRAPASSSANLGHTPIAPRVASSPGFGGADDLRIEIDRATRIAAESSDRLAREAIAIARDAVERLERLEVKMADLVLAKREASRRDLAAAPSSNPILAAAEPLPQTPQTPPAAATSAPAAEASAPAAEASALAAVTPVPAPAPSHGSVPTVQVPAAKPSAPLSGTELIARTDAGWESEPTLMDARELPEVEAERVSKAPPKRPSSIPVVTAMPDDPLSLPISIAPRAPDLPTAAPGVDLSDIDAIILANAKSRRRTGAAIVVVLIALVAILVVMTLTSRS